MNVNMKDLTKKGFYLLLCLSLTSCSKDSQREGSQTSDPEIPGAPLNLIATPGTYKVTLSWSPGSKGAFEITGYEYQYNTSPHMGWSYLEKSG